VSVSAQTAAPLPDFICGVDVSWLQQIEAADGVFTDADGQPVDALEFFRDQGVNTIRLRIWHTPADGANDLDATLAMAKRIDAMDMGLLLDFHYADSWADPDQQPKPAAWADLSFEELTTAVHDYTVEVLTALDEQGTPPEMVQIGNEITNGMIWPDGQIEAETLSEDGWPQLIALLQAGTSAVRETLPDTQIMIHIDEGGSQEISQWYYDHLADEVEYDIIGLSYYPRWQGTLTELEGNLDMLAERYQKPIIVVETAYPWTLDWTDDTHNPIGLPEHLHEGYPASPEGQQAFLNTLVDIISATPDNLGAGFFYWEPDAISTEDFGSSWENLAQFDFDGQALPSMDVYNVCQS
jgi:arabinogalactan endo-1,4-beta-galactosidase